MKKTTAFFIFIPSIVLIAFLFTNATSVDSEQIYLQNLKRYTVELSEYLSSNQFGEEEKKILRIKKLNVTMAIANVVSAKTCLDIIVQDPDMLSGSYVTYRNGLKNSPEARECQVNNRQIVQDIFINDIDARTACQMTDTCLGLNDIQQIKTCRSVGAKKYCDADSLLAPPILLQTLSGSCVQNQTFGFDEKGLWVDKGCAAKFRIARIPTAGEISRWNYDYLKKRDEEDIYMSAGALGSLSRAVEQRSKTLANLLRAQFEKSLLVRKQSRDVTVIRERESVLSTEAEKWTQEYIHNSEITSCDHLESEMSKNRGALYTGTYYFYFEDDVGEEEHRPFNLKGFSVKTAMSVDESPTFCNFTRLVQKTSGVNMDIYVDSSLKVEGLFTSEDGFGASKLPTRAMSAYVEPNCGNLGDVAVRCVAKKDVEYNGKSLYSFIDPAKMGTKVINANGVRFCFSQNESFNFAPGNIVHGYQCAGGTRLKETVLDPYVMTERGMMMKAGTFSSLSRIEDRSLVGCLSAKNVAAHFERNQRSMLVSNDVQDLSSQIYKRSEVGGERYYCISSGEPLVFSDENLVEGYLYSKDAKYPRFKIIEAPDQSVTGFVDYVSVVNNQLDIRGWACNKGINKSISVVITLHNTVANKGRVVATVDAKNTNEVAVSAACKTTGVGHRFRALVSKDATITSGAKIFAEGVSTDLSLANVQLSGSGKLSVP